MKFVEHTPRCVRYEVWCVCDYNDRLAALAREFDAFADRRATGRAASRLYHEDAT